MSEQAPESSSFQPEKQQETATADRLEHWLSRFGGGQVPILELPLDRPRPARRGFNAGRAALRLEPELVDPLRALGASTGGGLQAALLTGFAATLHRISAQDDLVIGLPAPGWLGESMLPVRIAIVPQLSFEALLRAVAATLTLDLAHPLADENALLQRLGLQDDPSRPRLASVGFDVDVGEHLCVEALQDSPSERPSGPRSPDLRHARYELSLRCRQSGRGADVEAHFDADLFDAASVERWLGMYRCLLLAALADPQLPVGRLNVLSDKELAALQALQPAATPIEAPARMHAAFVRQAARAPDRAAVRDGERRWTYRQLDEQSNRLAQALRSRGIGRGDRVGLCLPRSGEMMIALLAVLKSGAAYVPLDPAFPVGRLDYFARDAGLCLLLTASDVRNVPASWCPDAASRLFVLDREEDWLRASPRPLAPSERDAGPEDPAYLIYTSGSTGKPKGVCVPHAAVANLLQSMRQAPGLAADDRLAAVTTLSFDMAVPEVMLPLTVGAEIVIVRRGATMVGAALRDVLEQCGVTVLQATPGTWRLLLAARWKGGPRFKALIGAEPLPPDLAYSLLQQCGELWNLYGPTETTVWSTLWRVSAARLAAGGVSVGQPMANTTVWIVDANGQRCPIGVPGEIVIGGAGVTLGYLNREQLTAERFIPDPWGPPGARLYRTGDRGRWGNDGLLEHLGRFDFQVKVRGYRIELGEIEAACNDWPEVGSSVVVTREDGEGEVGLIAYLSPAPGARIDLAGLEQRLGERLPKYMLPHRMVVLEAIPVLPNGKVDRKSLPDPFAAPAAGVGAPGAPAIARPRDEHEHTVLARFEEVLGRSDLGVHSNFFAVGGNSLAAARLARRLGREFQRRVPLRLVFEQPTVARLAPAIQALDLAEPPPDEALRALPGRRHAPLTLRQERIRLHAEIHPASAAYNLPSAQRLAGALDLAHFKAALAIVIARQPALRTAIRVDPISDDAQTVVREDSDFELPLVNLGGLPASRREAALDEQLNELADRPIALSRAPLFHAALFRLSANEHVFAFVAHRLIWDGWSFDLLQHELSAAYAAQLSGRPHGLPPLALTPGDHAEWEARWLGSAACRRQLGFWKDRFASTAPATTLATDAPRRAGSSNKWGRHRFTIDAALSARLRLAAVRHEATLNLLALCAYVLSLSQLGGAGPLLVAIAAPGREAAELEPLIGPFDNLLPMPFQVDPAWRLGEFIGRVRRDLVAAMDHLQLPAEQLLQEPGLAERRLAHGALHQATYSFHDARERPRSFGGLSQTRIRLARPGARDELGMRLFEWPELLEGTIFYDAELYLPATAEALAERFAELLEQLTGEAERPLAALLSPGDSVAAARLLAVAAQAAGAQAVLRAAAASTGALKQQESGLARIWAQALGIDPQEIRSDANFFDLGGDSLQVGRVMQRAERELGLKVEPQRYVFETLSQLCAAAPMAPAAVKHGPLRRWLMGASRNRA